MDKKEILQMKLNSFVPAFNKLVEINKTHNRMVKEDKMPDSDKQEILKEFTSTLHPKNDIVCKGDGCTVYGARKTFNYTYMCNGILKTTVENTSRRFYPFVDSFM